MSKKSSTNVHIAATASKIRTKRNVTKIHCICAGIPGLALRSQVTPLLFTHLQLGRMRQTPADIVARISLVLGSLRLPRAPRWL
jgi:hypothetical protein